jgi:hypothetical protein
MANLEPVEPRTTPMIIRQKARYQQGTSLMRLVRGQGERSQVPHHRLISGGN